MARPGERIAFDVRTFRMGTSKEAALKPLEEAAEVYAAWQEWDWWLSNVDRVGYEQPVLADVRTALADELADCVTACCNLAARYNIDLSAALRRVEERNRERERYE